MQIEKEAKLIEKRIGETSDIEQKLALAKSVSCHVWNL